MSKAITEQGNVMVPGSTGSGKTVFCAQTVQVFLARADVSQRRNRAAARRVRRSPGR